MRPWDLGVASGQVTVADDDAPTVAIDTPAAAVAEGGTLRFPVTLDRAAYRDITLDYAVTGGTAGAGDHADTGGGTLTVPAGDTTAHIDLDVVDDSVDEPDEETVEVTISNIRPVGAATPGMVTATGTITDDDVAPTVTLVLTPSSIGESGEASTVTASLDRPSSADTTVTVTLAEADAYTLNGNPVLTIAAGATTSAGAVTITATGDDEHAPDKIVTVSAMATNAQGVTAPQAVTLTIEDDDDSPAAGTVTVTGAATEGETLTADMSGIVDADGLDNAQYVYQWIRTPSGDGDVDIADAAEVTYVAVFADVGATLKVRVTVTDDEGHEATFTSAPTSAVAALSRPSVTVASDRDVTEGDTVSFTLTRTGDTTQPLDVAYALTATGDFGVTTGAGTVTFPANSSTVQVSVSTTNDGVHEVHGLVTLSLTADTGADAAYLPVDPSAATAAVEDDDNSPAIGVVTVTGMAREGETLTVNMSGIVDKDGLDGAVFNCQWVRTRPGGSDEDISGATGAVYVPVFADAGATLKVRVAVTDDEGHEATFTSAATSAVAVLSRPDVTVTSGGDVTEGSAAVFTLTRTGDTVAMLDVAWTVTAAGDFGAATGASTATFPAGSSTFQVSVATTDDGVHETHGSVRLSLTADTGADPAWMPGDPATATVAVKDDDNAAPTGMVTIDDMTPVVGQMLSADMSNIVDEDGLDGAVFNCQWVRIPPGGSNEDITVSTGATYMPVLADAGTRLKVRVTVTDDEGHEATLVSAATSAVAAPTRPEVTVVTDGDVTEGSPVLFTLTRTGDQAQELDVAWRTTASGDFGAATGAGTATFPANSSTTQVSVATTDDGAHEAHGSVTLSLIPNPDVYDLGVEASTTAMVKDDDNAAPTGAVKIDNTTPVAGQTLIADASDVDDPDGLTNRNFTWQWIRVSGGTETETAGATSASYKVVAADVGSTLKVRVGFTDDGGTEESVESAPTETIVNTDATPRAWFARFGRTVAGQVVDAVDARMRMTSVRQPGSEVSVAGRRIEAPGADGPATSHDAAAARLADWLAGETYPEERTTSGSELLTGTSFALTEGTAESDFVSLWARGVLTDFDGADGELSVDGEVATGLLGVDWTRDDWSAGVIVGHSRADGDYSGQDLGTVSSSLTGFYPWGRQDLNDRVSVWGVAGYGVGTLTLDPEGKDRIETDMDLALAAAGLRGVLMAAPAEGGVELTAKTDGLIVHSASEAARVRDGRILAAASAGVTRLRLGLEGARAFRSAGGGTLTPSFGLGVRHDGGDVETGFGVDVGAGITYADPSSGVTADLHGRGLLAHEESRLREVGFSGSLAFDPTPSSDRGLSLRLGQTIGASATGGVDALYGRDTMAGLGARRRQGSGRSSRAFSLGGRDRLRSFRLRRSLHRDAGAWFRAIGGRRARLQPRLAPDA